MPLAKAELCESHAAILIAALGSGMVMCGCGGSSGSNFGTGGGGGEGQTAAPTISTTAAQQGAVIVSLATTTSGAGIFYTVDGSTPTATSPQYLAPFLVASNLTVNAIAIAGNSAVLTPSTVTTQTFTPNIPSGTLVWSDEFTNNTGAIAEPDPTVWTYDTGNSGFGNDELENYCAWGSNTSPCSTTNPSEFVGTPMGISTSRRNSLLPGYTRRRV